MDKKALRAKFKDIRDGQLLSDAQRASLLDNLRFVIDGNDLTVAGYAPIKSEIDISFLAEEFDFYALPVMQLRQMPMRFRFFNGVLEKSRHDILEPPSGDFIEPNIVLVPLLAFDCNGHRLGYGQGYYDITLEALRKENPYIIAIGVAFDVQMVEGELPVEAHDQKLDFVVTPTKVHSFV